MTTSSGLNGPRTGDVVITRTSATKGYLLREFRGATQLMFYTREDAICDATTFAEIHHVDVWFTEGEAYIRIGGYRARRRAGHSA